MNDIKKLHLHFYHEAIRYAGGEHHAWVCRGKKIDNISKHKEELKHTLISLFKDLINNLELLCGEFDLDKTIDDAWSSAVKVHYHTYANYEKHKQNS